MNLYLKGKVCCNYLLCMTLAKKSEKCLELIWRIWIQQVVKKLHDLLNQQDYIDKWQLWIKQKSSWF